MSTRSFSLFLRRRHAHRRPRRRRTLARRLAGIMATAGERAQSTAEYALVLVAVTSMVGVVIAYISGDGGGVITGLFGAAFAKMRSLIGG